MATSTSISSYFLSGGVFSRRSPASLPFHPITVAMARSRAVRAVAVADLAADEGMEKKPKKKLVTGIMKPRPISPELQELVGAKEMGRTDVIKAVWAYIKENKLQDPEKKRIIVCDEKLKKVFGGKDRVDFLEVSRLLTPHILK